MKTSLNLRRYVLDGKLPVVEPDLLIWANWLEESDRTVCKTLLGSRKKVVVSTIFLGLDHNYTGKGQPVLFETMVFGIRGEKEPPNNFNRYRTWEEAEKGHAEIVASVRRWLRRQQRNK